MLQLPTNFCVIEHLFATLTSLSSSALCSFHPTLVHYHSSTTRCPQQTCSQVSTNLHVAFFFMKLYLPGLMSDFSYHPLKTRYHECRPAQLHPNSWAFVRAFYILCNQFGFVLTSYMFFYFLNLKCQNELPGPPWVGSRIKAYWLFFNCPTILSKENL